LIWTPATRSSRKWRTETPPASPDPIQSPARQSTVEYNRTSIIDFFPNIGYPVQALTINFFPRVAFQLMMSSFMQIGMLWKKAQE